MGKFDLAFECLYQAIDDKTNFVNMLAVEPLFHPLRADPRFAKLLKKQNFAP
jgi:serine/threonine-protein kinase